MTKVGRKKKDRKMCDPAVCQFCEYIGEGDFICTKDYTDAVLVMMGWTPTDNYLKCRRADA